MRYQYEVVFLFSTQSWVASSSRAASTLTPCAAILNLMPSITDGTRKRVTSIARQVCNDVDNIPRERPWNNHATRPRCGLTGSKMVLTEGNQVPSKGVLVQDGLNYGGCRCDPCCNVEPTQNSFAVIDLPHRSTSHDPAIIVMLIEYHVSTLTYIGSGP